MKGYKKWSVLTLIVGMATLFSSCAVHRHTRPHRHHPHRHKVVIIAEQTTRTGQNTAEQTTRTGQNTDCITFEECLAMTEPDSYGSTE